MKIYAHRGNVAGPNPERENTISHINEALASGYCVELDVSLSLGELYLGHDFTRLQEKVEKIWLENSRFLVHCKTLDTFLLLSKFSNIHSFYQEDDSVALSTWGKCIIHNKVIKNKYDDKDIIVSLRPTEFDLSKYYNANGIVTDYCNRFQIENKDKMFKLLLIDIDGVLTNGNKAYDASHTVVSKQFNDRDFTAIKRFKAAGIPVVAISGDIFNRDMCEKRNIPFLYSRNLCGGLDKSRAIPYLIEKYGVSPDKMAYIGDDYYDISLLNSVRYPFCPANAAYCVQKVSTTIPRFGGEGVLDALWEMYKDKLPHIYPEDNL